MMILIYHLFRCVLIGLVIQCSLVQFSSAVMSRSKMEDACRPERGWPHKGELQVKGVEVRYRDELPLVLRGVTFNVGPGEKVGICGRTGCGKSTLLLAMFRIVELHKGSITLDGIDISSIGLKDLRSSLSFVSQDPVVFSGSVRSNLDPEHRCSDEAVSTALRQAGLEDWVSSLEV
jgi:ATP-binding cassette, subfamily C (CFTR/MRP), member 1